MPLSPPAPRERIHDRSVTCVGYEREDGLWDIEGHLVDTKTYAFTNRHRGDVAAGEPVHEMWLRVTIDDDLLVHRVEAATDHAPFAMCPDITPRFSVLEGLRIGPGWRAAVRARLGGAAGCTHLVELLGPIATTAYQTLARRRREREAAAGDARPRTRPVLLDTCHAFAAGSPVVRELWPEHYTGAGDGGEGG